ncbi:MAG TPA: glycosyltransferase [Campylobacterales bacterium]|nr:glycosyltransferase [Campylobacterales bacterium]
MKKLLIVTRWYLPAVKSGGTVRSLIALVDRLKDSFDIIIITSDRDLGAVEPYKNIEFDTLIRKDGIGIIYLSSINVSNMHKYMKMINPDILYINSFFDITTQSIMVLKLLKLIKADIILAPRGELAFGALSIKPTKKKIYLTIYKLLNMSKNITFHATSKEDLSDIKKIFPSNNIEIIQNLKEENKNQSILPYKNRDSLKIVFISRIAPVKNLHYALSILKDTKIEESLIFDIYGPIEDKDYWLRCQQIFADMPDNITISYKGFVEPSMIQSTLGKYHLFFLPTKGENFGHAIVEAMQVGLIPLISNKTPWQDLESFTAGFSLSLENPDSFSTAIRKVAQFDNEEFLIVSENVKKYITQKVNSDETLEKYKIFFNK